MKKTWVASCAAAVGAALSIAGSTSAQTFTPSVLWYFGANVAKDQPLVEGHDGWLYGVSSIGGLAGQGFIYKNSPTGTLRVIYNFSNDRNGNENPIEPTHLIAGMDGNFYGTTTYTNYSAAVVFKLTPAGTFSVLHTFVDANLSNLVQGRDGKLYGIGNDWNQAQTQIIPVLFSLGLDGAYNDVPLTGTPVGGLIDGQDGFFYAPGFNSICRVSVNGTVSPIYQLPYSSTKLTLGSDGYLYGSGSSQPNGNIFKISESGAFTQIHAFAAGEGAFASQSVQDVSGKFYTVTSSDTISGGPNDGTVTSFDSNGNIDTVLALNNTYGSQPYSGVTISHTGDMYLLTNLQGSEQNGTILKLSRSAGGSATHFAVTPILRYPDSVVAGTQASFVVTALDSSNNIAQGYTGTVHFSSTDHSAVLPANVKLTNGRVQLAATLNTIGNQTITATDTVNGGINGTSSGIDVPGAATHIAVSMGLSTITAGQNAFVAVQAFDASNDLATGYAGTLHFTSTNSHDTMPADTGLVNGASVFAINMTVAGTRTITVTDTGHSTIHGSVQVTVNGAPAIALHLGSTVNWVNAGTPISVHVVAVDQYNNTDPSYSGTVVFSCSDHTAILPSPSHLTNGAAFFNITMHQAGLQTLIASDSVYGVSRATKQLGVYPLAVKHLGVYTPASVTAGAPFNFGVKALD